MTSTQRFSLCSETASAATSLSEKSVNASIAPDDGTASTRALAGSVLNMKLDALGEAAAVPSTSQPMNSSSGQTASLSSLEGIIAPGYVTKRTRRRLAAEKHSIDGDSTEEGGGEEVASAKRPRRRPDKQQSLSAESSSISAEDGGSERVRFDHHVSFIEAEEAGNGRSRERRKKNGSKELEENGSTTAVAEKQRSMSFLRRIFSR